METFFIPLLLFGFPKHESFVGLI